MAEMLVLRENSPTNSRRMPLRQPAACRGVGEGGAGEGGAGRAACRSTHEPTFKGCRRKGGERPVESQPQQRHLGIQLWHWGLQPRRATVSGREGASRHCLL